MEIVKKYVDDGSVVGLLYQNGIYCVAVSLEFAVKHELPDAEIGSYLEAPTIDVKTGSACILYPIDSATHRYNDGVWHCIEDGEDTSRDIDIYYHCGRDEICVGDYIFKRSSMIILDDMTAYKRCKTGKDIM